MTNTNSDSPDIFVANKSYPDARGLFFDGYQTLEQVRDACVVVLDTNALLVPYGISKNGLSEIASTYKSLADAKRLVVPGQVAREFAKNRPVKIGEIYQAISRKQNVSPEKASYPLLEDVPSYQKLRELEDEFAKLMVEYRRTVGDVLNHIRDWNWNDPVSNLYSKLFREVVIDPVLDEDFIQKRLEYLHKNKVPPGYKDGSKLDQGVGDLLVWQVAVQVANERKAPVVLVSGDAKADWFYRSEGQALFPRFELVDEIRRVSDGKSLHIISFSRFLELFGAGAEAVGEARTEEIKIDLSTMSSYGRNSVLAYVAEQAVSNWLQEQYSQLEIRRDDRTGTYAISDDGGATSLVSVKYFPESRQNSLVYHRLRDSLRRFEQRYREADWVFDNILVFLVFESEPAADQTARTLPEILGRMGHSDARVVVAHLPNGGSLRVYDPLNALPIFE
jgi:hypothetical protein